MAERVVDLLEPVEVEEQHRDPGTTLLGFRERLVDPAPEEIPVREAGQPVVQSLVLDLFKVAAQPPRDSPEEREEREVQPEQRQLEDTCHRDEGLAGGRCDRAVILMQCERSGLVASPDSDGTYTLSAFVPAHSWTDVCMLAAGGRLAPPISAGSVE